MLDNFQLAAIVKRGRESQLFRIPLDRHLQNTLSEDWERQYLAFVDGVNAIAFDAGYSPEEHERFALEDYALPGWIAGETSQTVQNLDSIGRNDALLDSVKSIVAFARDENRRELILFQNFSRSHVIRPGHLLFMANDTYQSSARPGITLDSKLSAVYLQAPRTLLFQSFRTVNTFLPLADFYEEASEQQIREVLAHQALAPEDVDATAVGANQWFRKRFALLRDSGVLDNYTPRQIQQRAIGYDVGRVCQVVEKFRRVIIRRDDVTTLPSSPPSDLDTHQALAV